MFGYANYVKKLIKQKNYNKIIILSTLPGVLLENYLVKFKKHEYILDIKRMLKIVAIKVNWSKQLTMMIALIVQSIVASSGKNFYIQVICMVVIIYKQKDIVKKIFNRLVKKESIK